MKKTLVILSLLMTMFVSCTDGNADVKKCWEFTLTNVTEMLMGTEVMNTSTTVTTVNECGMTAAEAKDAAAGMDGVSTTTSDAITLKITITVTYKEVAE